MNASDRPTTHVEGGLASWALILVAMVLPTAAAWVYFITLAGRPGMAATYLAAKAAQALLPLVGWYALGMHRHPAWSRPAQGWGSGILAGALLSLPAVVLYAAFLRGTALLEGAPAQIEQRLDAFHATTLGGYLALALALSLLHSLFEEYYWRWFLFAALRERMAWWAALTLSSAAFAAHHAVVIAGLLGPGAPAWVIAAGTLAVAVAGATWSWLYQRHGSLLAPWASHVVVDLAVMAIGLDLIRAG